MNNVPFIWDIKNGKAGYNDSPLRGADTFHPFRDNGLKLLTISKEDFRQSSSSVSFSITINVPTGYIAIGLKTSMTSGPFYGAGCDGSISSDRKLVSGSFGGGYSSGAGDTMRGTLVAYCIPEDYVISNV